MARAYRLGLWRRLINWMIGVLLRLGVSPPHTYLLTVRGRKSGHPYSTPVTLVEEAGERWLVAPYGEVGWVRNARVAEQITLTRGRRFENVRILELSAEDAAPVLKKYLTQVPVVRPFFDVTSKSSLPDFVAEASRHPVFRIDQRHPDILFYTTAELNRIDGLIDKFNLTSITQLDSSLADGNRLRAGSEIAAMPCGVGGQNILAELIQVDEIAIRL